MRPLILNIKSQDQKEKTVEALFEQMTTHERHLLFSFLFDEYIYSSLQAQRYLDMSASSIYYYVSVKKLKPIYSFNVQKGHHPIRLFLKDDVEAFDH